MANANPDKVPTPGEILQKEFIDPRDLTHYRLAHEIDVPCQRITQIVTGIRGISAETDLRLCRFFSLPKGYWLRLQAKYDTYATEPKLAEALAAIQPWKPTTKYLSHPNTRGPKTKKKSKKK